MSHLKRDVKFLVDHIANPELSGYGTKLMELLNKLFEKVKLWRRLRQPRDPDDPNDLDLVGEEREAEAQNILEEMRGIAKKFKETALDRPGPP